MAASFESLNFRVHLLVWRGIVREFPETGCVGLKRICLYDSEM